jgi:hypothetical protein
VDVATLPPAVRELVEAMAVRDPLPANRAIAAPIADRLRKRQTTMREVRAALSSRATPEEVVQALGPAAQEQLASIARGSNVTLAERALPALVLVSPRKARPVVEDLAGDRRGRLRAAAATAAARVPGGRAIVEPLLADDDPNVRAAAFVAAARLRFPRMRELASELLEKDPDERVRQLAAEFLRGPERQH